ncbi:hypothetical protein GCM10009678_04760 [Actinomadura kijaniata]|uniref:Integrase n=1 Tax=Actinomadura namibiensis TaxID=182080 RepID=A0A7W3LTD6_ACTNM|nr:hypothetical protein [Actinomadura namibiensis]MBA8953958.1 integrase [Actinomadura namibiensis]
MTRARKTGPGSTKEPGPGPQAVSYEVRISENIQRIDRAKGKRSYRVRWRVAGHRKSQNFTNSALAISFQSKLRTAANEGEPFDVESGLPVSLIPKEEPEEAAPPPTWYEFAMSYADMKWKEVSPKSRRGIAEALGTATLALVRWEDRSPAHSEIYQALTTWAFTGEARSAEPPAKLVKVIDWVKAHSVDVTELADPDLLREVLRRLSLTLDGTKAAPATYWRKRATFYNALSYAVQKKHFDANPLPSVSWTPPKSTDVVERNQVVNEVQGHALVDGVGRQGSMGQHLQAFFGCLFLAGLRPGEAVLLDEDKLDLPENEDEWGWIHLGDSSPEVSGRWTDSGKRERRSLKHRSEKETRSVPVCPPLCKLLRRHIALFGTAPDGRLFRGESGDVLSESVYSRVWQATREAVLAPHEVRGPLARRPYDLRHARLSIWLNAGIHPPQVAEWAGNSVKVLLGVYAKCLTGGVAQALAKLGWDQGMDVQEQQPLDYDVEWPIRLEEVTWCELALDYVDWKWETIKPTTRRGVVEALTKVTMAMLPRKGPWPTTPQLGRALTTYAFNRDRWENIPGDQAEVIAWVEQHSPLVGSLADVEILRSVLEHLGTRLDGQPAQPAVAARRRSVLFNVLEFAVAQKALASNPLLFRSWGPSDSGSRIGPDQP